jgi:hypothetical protein
MVEEIVETALRQYGTIPGYWLSPPQVGKIKTNL